MHFIITVKLLSKNNELSIHMNPDIPETELKKGDTIIFRGVDPFKSTVFYKIANRLTSKGIDYIVETDGSIFGYKEQSELILKKYRFKEIIIKIFTLSFSENDRITGCPGNTKNAFFGMRNLKQLGQKVSLITTINTIGFIKKIEDFYNIKQQYKLEYLYLELEENLTIENRRDIIKEITSKFKEYDDIIIRNNSFDIKIGSSKREKIDISLDGKNGTGNLVLKNFCTNNCTFCTTRIVSAAYNSPLPYDHKKDVIEIIKKESKKLKNPKVFEIVAVEPLEHPDIFEILSICNNIGFEYIRLLTHGRLLKNKSLVDTLCKLKVKEIIIPISYYSPESALQNVGDISAFKDIDEALKTIRSKRTISFLFNIMISKQNYKDIEKITEFLKSHGINNLNFNLALPSIEDHRFFIPYGVSFSELLTEVSKIKKENLRERIFSSLSYTIPPCILIKYSDPALIKKIKIEYNNITKKSLSSKRDYSKYKSTTRCTKSDKCRYGSFCIGTNTVYIKTFGDEEFLVIK